MNKTTEARLSRSLLVIADDFGIGPATSDGIIDLARRGLVTGTVLLVNSPFAEQAVRDWQRADIALELGWHPCLTLDRPILPASRVPSLVGPDGCFRPLGAFLRRLLLGRVRADEIALELAAQHQRFRELTGQWPGFVNAHHHVQVFPPIGAILTDLLSRQSPLPYLRRVREPWTMLARIPGARGKRLLLSRLGKRASRHQQQLGLPGNDWLAGITNPACTHDPQYLTRWLQRIPGQVVELTCHPGHHDETLLGRDATPEDGQLERRVQEYRRLADPGFLEAVQQAGFRLTCPSELQEADVAAGELQPVGLPEIHP